MGTLTLEGKTIYLARVEGLQDVFNSPNFILAKSRWVEDQEVNSCVLCGNKFNQLRRKHHCRQCGRILCNKCCNEKIPLPQLGSLEPERVCESCRPVTEYITKSRSPLQNFKVEAIGGITNLCREIQTLRKVVELGGVQTLIAMSKDSSPQILANVVSGLQILSTHEPLHKYLADAGAIKAVCSVLMQTSELLEQTLLDGISTLMIFCKLPALKTKALEDGALEPALKLCNMSHSTVSLIAVSTLSLIVEHPDTHDKVVDSKFNVLSRLCALCGSPDEQMREVTLKTLAHISMGSDWQRHRIVQEDFTSGRSIRTVIKSQPRNEQVLCNAACLIANLATSSEDQGGLQELMDCLCDVLKSDTKNTDLLLHVTRGIANFAKYQQNVERLKIYLPVIVFKCLKSSNPQLKLHGMRTVFYLLSVKPADTAQELVRDGADDLLQGIAKLPGLMDAVYSALQVQAPEIVKPM